MRRASLIGALLGLALLTALVLWQGAGLVAQTFTEIGWRIFWVPLLYLVPMAAALLSWLYLFPPRKLPGLGLCTYGLWINFAINWLLPVGQVGGELARMRLLIQRQYPAPAAIASVVGDQTLQLISQALYGLLGLLLLYGRLGRDWGGQLWGLLGASLLVIVAISGGFYWVQHRGLFRLLSRVARKFPRLFNAPSGQSLEQQAQAIDQALQQLYQRRDRLLMAVWWRMAFRLTAAAETWLVLWLLGAPVGIAEALILESLGQAIRSAAFVIPGGLGAQEGGLMAIGTVLGLPPSLGLSLSLCKRVRELLIGVPGLVALQIAEGRRLVNTTEHKG
ncbi:MAG: lysylphosphatidylglycerol synthase domain-containing protein [Cyanobacteria bacterium P01_A01_bin.135]